MLYDKAKVNIICYITKFLCDKNLALNLIIKREFPCLQAGDDSAFVHTFFWFKSPTHGAWES